MQSQPMQLSAITVVKMLVVGADKAPVEEVVKQALTFSNNENVPIEVAHKGKVFIVSSERIVSDITKEVESFKKEESPKVMTAESLAELKKKQAEGKEEAQHKAMPKK